MTALIDIQAAVLNILRGDMTLTSLVNGIVDFVDDELDYPYITVGEATEAPFNTFNRNGKELTITIHIWSNYKGFKEGLTILKQLNRLLDDAELNLSEHDPVLIQFEDAQTIRDDSLRHIPVTYRIIVQEAENE